MPTRVLLIRHCPSRADREAPPATWGLTELGRARAETLRSELGERDPVAIACGDEPKMIQTVEPLGRALGVPLEVGAAYDESHSEGWHEVDRFRSIVSEFFRDPKTPPAPGWEPAGEAAERFLSALGQLCRRHGDATVAVCSGGRVLTAVLHQLGLVPPGESFDTWGRIQMPDLAVVELGASEEPALLRPFGSMGRGPSQ